LTEDFSSISRLLERVKLARVPMRRHWEDPRVWSTCRRRVWRYQRGNQKRSLNIPKG
jgi:hypothetical protein